MARACHLTRVLAATVLLLATIASGAGLAQAGGDLRGVVTEEAGGAVAGASIVVSDDQGRQVSTKSNAQGQFQIVLQDAKAVTLTVEAAGFATFSRRIAQPASTPTVVDVALRIAASARVDVNGSLTGLALGSGQNMSAITLSGSTLELLPADPESLLQTLRMLAGTTGTRADQVVFYVDGVPIDRRLPPRDIIQQVRINANPFSAEFAEPGSSRVDIITKPASDTFHGDGRFDFNDSVLNARNLFEPAKPRVQLRTYIAYVGGPVVKNRLGMLVYGALWDRNENAVVDARTIDPATALVQPVRLNVATPVRTTSYSFKSDALLSKRHILMFEFARDDQRERNAGLLTGFDLPEHGYARRSREDTARIKLTSTVGDRGLNEFLVNVSRRRLHDQANSTSPAVIVLDGFSGGGSPEAQLRDDATDRIMVSNTTTREGQRQSLRFGGQVQYSRLVQLDRANYNGTFTFGSDIARDALGNPLLDAGGAPIPVSGLELYRQTLLRIPGALPSQFSIANGDPTVAFSVTTAAGFLQSDWRLPFRVTLSYGVRAEFEQELQTQLALAHRVGVAWAPSSDGRTALRAGYGFFYTPVPDVLISDVLRSRQTEWRAVGQPDFFPVVPGTLPAAVVMTTRTEAPGLGMPLLTLSTVSLDRQITARLFGSVGFTRRRGTDLLRTRVLPPAAGERSILGPTLQFESTGRSTADEWHLTINGTIGSGVNLFSSYQRTRAFQDTDGPYTIPSDSTNLSAEWGPAPIPRHQALVGASFTMANGLAIMPMLRVSSALPFSVTTGRDNNGDLQFTDRPALANAGDSGAVVTPYGVFNPNPSVGQAVIPRNSASGPTEVTLDLAGSWSLQQVWSESDRASLTIMTSNLTNRINYAPYNGVLNSPFFGTANRALNPRRVTISLRYEF